MESAGIYVIMSTESSMEIQNGIMAGVNFAIDVLPMPQPMKRHVPTGGVQSQMHRFAIIMMPNWMSVMPNSRMIGRKIGVKIRTAGVMSMKAPTTSRSRLMKSRMTTVLEDRDSSQALTVPGMFATVMIQLM